MQTIFHDELEIFQFLLNTDDRATILHARFPPWIG